MSRLNSRQGKVAFDIRVGYRVSKKALRFYQEAVFVPWKARILIFHCFLRTKQKLSEACSIENKNGNTCINTKASFFWDLYGVTKIKWNWYAFKRGKDSSLRLDGHKLRDQSQFPGKLESVTYDICEACLLLWPIPWGQHTKLRNLRICEPNQ